MFKPFKDSLFSTVAAFNYMARSFKEEGTTAYNSALGKNHDA